MTDTMPEMTGVPVEVTTLTKMDRDPNGGFMGSADTIAVLEPAGEPSHATLPDTSHE